MENPPDISISAFGKTDVGLIREHNEDNFLVADTTRDVRTHEAPEPVNFPLGPKGALFLVCDGMGGAAAGEVASQMAVDSIAATLAASAALDRQAFARRLRRAIEDANDRIFIQSRDNQSERGMGTTCTAAALVDGTLIIGQIGDSRCYVMRQGRLSQVTKDQSLAWQLMEAGAMTAEEAKGFEHANIILQALGVQERVEVVLSQVDLRRGDVVLISSDGLHGPVSDEEMVQILQDAPDIKTSAEQLIRRALDRDGPDNVTVVMAKFDGPDLAAPGPEDLVQFVPYDPGSDPNEARRDRAEGGEKVTVEVTIPRDAIRQTGHHDGTTSEIETAPHAAAGMVETTELRERGSSLLTFIVVTLLAAVAAGAFIKCDRSRTLERESQAAAARARATETAPPAPATP